MNCKALCQQCLFEGTNTALSYKNVIHLKFELSHMNKGTYMYTKVQTLQLSKAVSGYCNACKLHEVQRRNMFKTTVFVHLKQKRNRIIISKKEKSFWLPSTVFRQCADSASLIYPPSTRVQKSVIIKQIFTTRKHRKHFFICTVIYRSQKVIK